MIEQASLLVQDAEILVSVIIPVYNGAPYLAETIESVLMQTHQKLELIIIDDGSSDNSPAIMRNWAEQDSRIRLLFQSHGGISRTMNTGIIAAQGEFIAYLDQDDIALPERLAIQLAYIRQAGVDICGSWALQFGDQHKVMVFPEKHEAIQIELLFYCALLQPTVMLRAAIAKKNLYAERVNFLDYEIWTRLALQYRMGNIPQILTKYRRHVGQTHVRRAALFRADRIKCRGRYFYALFPQAAPQEYKLLEKIAEIEKVVSIVELQQAGDWLLNLLQARKIVISAALGQRWLGVCRRSSYLGYSVFQVYCHYSAEFPHIPWQQKLTLWGTCILRLNVESGSYKLLTRIKNKCSAFRYKTSAKREDDTGC